MILAAITAASPTGPAPNTTRLLPGGAANTPSTAPAPVCSPQPSGPSSSSGASSRTFTTLRRWATTWSPKEDWPKKCPLISVPSASR